jgi:integrase
MKTISEVYAELLTEHYSRPKFQTSSWRKQVESHWKLRLEKPFGECEVTKVTAHQVMEWHIRLEAIPESANRSKAILSKIFSHADLKGYTVPGFNPCRRVPNFKERKRYRFATDQEVRRVARVLITYKESHPREVAYIELLMLTASRPSAIRRLRKSLFTKHKAKNRTYGVCFFPGKSGEEKLVFSPRAVEVVDSVWELSTDDFILNIPFPRGLWGKVRIEAKCPDLWARDWRRTAASLGLASGVQTSVLRDFLNHKSEKMTDLYARTQLDAAFSASSIIEREMEKRM